MEKEYVYGSSKELILGINNSTNVEFLEEKKIGLFLEDILSSTNFNINKFLEETKFFKDYRDRDYEDYNHVWEEYNPYIEDIEDLEDLQKDTYFDMCLIDNKWCFTPLVLEFIIQEMNFSLEEDKRETYELYAS